MKLLQEAGIAGEYIYTSNTLDCHFAYFSVVLQDLGVHIMASICLASPSPISSIGQLCIRIPSEE